MPRRTTTRLRVATWNVHIAKRRPGMARRLRKAAAAIEHIASRTDAAVFQEFGQHTALLDLPGHDGWDPRGSRPPHLSRDRTLEVIDRESHRLAKGRQVGRVPGFRSVLGDYECSIRSYGTPADDPHGGLIVVVIGVHLPAHVEAPAGEVADTKRGDMWTECVRELAQVMVDAVTDGADVVVVVGDFNMRLSAGQPFRPLLAAGAVKVRPHAPTHRFREIDGGFVLAKPGVDVDVEACHVMRGPGLPRLPFRLFDHRPVWAVLSITTRKEKP